MFSNCLFSSLSETDRCFLEAPFDLDEIKRVVWEYGTDKTLGPDV